MQKKKIILTTIIAATAVGIAIYFFRKKRDKRPGNVYAPQKGVASWEYTL
jgi:uncharacterized membrane protein